MEIKGGAGLAKALAKYAENATNATSVKVGWLAGATEADGTPVAFAAAMTEFGSPSRGQPPRPAFRSMIAEKSPGWGPALGAQLSANGGDAHKALDIVGEGIAGQLRESIIAFTTPANAPSTIRRKGFDKPWVETGTVLNSVGVEVT